MVTELIVVFKTSNDVVYVTPAGSVIEKLPDESVAFEAISVSAPEPAIE